MKVTRERPHPIRYVLLSGRVHLKEVCERSGLAYEPMRRAANGECRPSRQAAEALSFVMGLPVESLFRTDELSDRQAVWA